jgi:small redox-active disulfide protein 2
MVKLDVLGMGCTKCQLLADRTEQAARELGLTYQLEKVTDVERIAAYHVLSTPALVIDGALQFSGRVPTVSAIKELLVASSPAR